jgi:hypothetical protein
MVVLRKRVLNTLYLWIASCLCHLGIFTFVDFLNLLASSLLGALLYTSRVLGLRPSALYLNLKLLIKKKDPFFLARQN